MIALLLPNTTLIGHTTLAKYNSDVCKWHLFVSNITEDVFHVLKDTFTLGYTHSLKFQAYVEQSEVISDQLQ